MTYLYRYKAFTSDNKVLGFINASNDNDASKIILSISLKPIFIYRCRFYFQRTSYILVSNWFKTLSNLMKEGIKVENCLEILSKDKNYSFSTSVLGLLKSGTSFSASIEKHRFFFGDVCVKIVRSVDKFMKIEDLSIFIAEFYLKIHNKSSDIKRVIMQPLITFVLSVLICSLIIFFIKDNLCELMNDFGYPEPFLFRMLNSMTQTRFLFALSVISIMIFYFIKSLEYLPIFKNYLINRDLFISFYCAAKAIENGVHVIDSLNLSMMCVNTKKVTLDFQVIKMNILNGNSIHKSFKNANIKDEYCTLIRINETCGKVSDGFLAISRMAEENMTKQLEVFSNYFPHLITCLTTTIVLSVFNSIFVPIYNSFVTFTF